MTPAGRCRDCLQPVLLARTEAHGRLFALDPEPDPNGNQAVMQPPAGPLQTRQLGKDDPPRPYETVYMPHVATCAGRKPNKPRVPAALPSNVIPINRTPSRQSGARPQPEGT